MKALTTLAKKGPFLGLALSAFLHAEEMPIENWSAEFVKNYHAQKPDLARRYSNKILAEIFRDPFAPIYRKTLEHFSELSETDDAYLDLLWKAQQRWTANYETTVADLKKESLGRSAQYGLYTAFAFNGLIRTPVFRRRYLNLLASARGSWSKNALRLGYSAIPAASLAGSIKGIEGVSNSLASFKIPTSPAEILGVKLDVAPVDLEENALREYVEDFYLAGAENTLANFVVEKAFETSAFSRWSNSKNCSFLAQLALSDEKALWPRLAKKMLQGGRAVYNTIQPEQLLSSMLLTAGIAVGVNKFYNQDLKAEKKYLEALEEFRKLRSTANSWDIESAFRRFESQTINLYRLTMDKTHVLIKSHYEKVREATDEATVARDTAEFLDSSQALNNPKVIELFYSEWERFDADPAAFSLSLEAQRLSTQNAGILALQALSEMYRHGRTSKAVEIIIDDYMTTFPRTTKNGAAE